MRFWNRGTPEDEPPPQVGLFGGIANVRIRPEVYAQEPPESIRQGVDTPSRPSYMPVVILTGMDPQMVAEGRFVAAIISPHPRASFPATRQTPDYPRANIRVPAHVAYGTLFTSAPARGY